MHNWETVVYESSRKSAEICLSHMNVFSMIGTKVVRTRLSKRYRGKDMASDMSGVHKMSMVRMPERTDELANVRAYTRNSVETHCPQGKWGK